MIIKTLDIISFGKFSNKTIELSDGFNLIYGKNESGKSTIMNFIFAMLYGFGDSRKKFLPFRERISPWNGSDAEGKITLQLTDGRIITIYRKCSSLKRNDTLKVFNSVTGEELAESPEELIGISADTFERTLFVRQSATFFQSTTEELSMRLSNLSSGGNEDISFDKAMKILDEMRRCILLQRGSGGELSKVEKELCALLEKKQHAENDSELYSSVLSRLSEAKKHLKAAQEELSSLENIDFSEAIAHNALLEEKQKTMLSLNAGSESSLKALKKAADEFLILEKYCSYEKTENYHDRKFLIASLFFGIAGIFLSFLNKTMALLFIPCLILLVAGLFFRRKTLSMLTMQFGTHDSSVINAKKQEAHIAETNYLNAKELYAKVLSDLKSAQTDYETSLSSFTKKFGFTPDELKARKSSHEMNMHTTKVRLIALSDEVSELNSQLIGTQVCDTQALDAQINALCERRDYLRHTFDAITLAGKALMRANSRIQLSFAPELNKKASSYFSQITNGKYTNILADKNLHISVCHDIPRSAELFSGATIDQMYLALRLALSDMLFGNEKIPFICDQIFTQYDSDRYENALNLMKNLSDKRQFLLFCGDEVSFSSKLATEILT